MEWGWHDSTRFYMVARFDTEKSSYVVTFSPDVDYSYEVALGVLRKGFDHDTYGAYDFKGLTHEFKMGRVLATVISVVKDFIRKEKPKSVFWKAKGQRARIYKLVSDRVARATSGYSVGVDSIDKEAR